MKDLTKIKTPFGLLKPKVRNAMHEHHDAGGTIQCYSVHGWMDCEPDWTEYHVYRVKPSDPIRPEHIKVSGGAFTFAGDQPHPIFAAVKEWQDARKGAGLGTKGHERIRIAAEALAAIKVPA